MYDTSTNMIDATSIDLKTGIYSPTRALCCDETNANPSQTTQLETGCARSDLSDASSLETISDTSSETSVGERFDDRGYSDIFFDLANNIADAGKRQLFFLDNGEYTTLFFEDQFGSSMTFVITELYKALDITISIKPTGIKATPGEQALIIDTCGFVIEDSEEKDFDLMLDEMETIIRYHQVAKRYKKTEEPQPAEITPWNNNSNNPMIETSGVCCDEFDGLEDSNLEYAPSEFAGMHVDKKTSTNYSEIWNVQETKNCKQHVLFSTTYNVSLIYEQIITAGNISAAQVCEQHPEFQLVFVLKSSLGKQTSLFQQLFHKKTFASKEDLDEKINSFMNLFDISNDESVRKISDADLVKDVLKTYFFTSSDPTMKMRAKDLLEMISLKLTVENPSIKKNLPGLLLENGLKKTRLKNGYHYYGIRPRDKDDDKAKIDFTSVMQRRKDELKELCKAQNPVPVGVGLE